MAEKLSDKLKKLFSKTRNAPGKGAYPAKFERTAFKAGQKTSSMMKALKPSSFMKAVDKPASASKALITASAAKKLRTASKVAKLARVATPLGLGTVAAQAVYDVATMSPEKKAKVKKLKTKLNKKSTKDYHADLLKMSTGGDTMLKGGQKKLDKNKDGKISGEDFKMMKAFKGQMADSKKSSQERSKLMVQLKKKISGAAISESEAEKLMNMSTPEIKSKIKNMYKGGESKGYGAARTQGEGLQDENLIPGKSLDYYKDIM